MSFVPVVVTDGAPNDEPEPFTSCAAETSTGLDVSTPPNADKNTDPPTVTFVVHVNDDSPLANTCVNTANAPSVS